MRRMSHLRSCILVMALATCANVAATARTQEPPEKRIELLVRQLGDDSYDARERAAQELLRIGTPAKAALFANMNSKDREIALRCRRLWSEMRIDAGWREVRKVIGDSPASRDLYDQMFMAAPAVWYEIAENPRAADMLFEERREQFQAYLRNKQLDNWEGAFANLLYFGVRSKQELPQKQLPRVDDMLSTARAQQALADSAPLREILGAWTNLTRSDGPAFDRLIIALRDRSPQTTELARELLNDREAPAKQRQYGLLALIRSSGPDDEKLIDDAINDSSSLDVLFAKGQVIKSQLRDVALAVRIARSGRDPAEFGFAHLRPNDDTTYSPSSLGFKDSAERSAAFERWSAFTGRRLLEKSP